ncbi:hypothetical protein V1520DRAFT_368205 [Lipomyces starkeyi]|uniref:SWIM-type domain-containing protein n=1 Tax=Lipomyces starkeyi NRRL Y-11557 TaxID=675824 RepID=A0A1E3QDJ8_LIPST|nr:hypothetical protein LIPSTDRAFT_1210 [Lipomyces starkeyi NRRL Y-11557]
MSSRVEGSHSALKGALGSSAGTLYTAGQKLNHWNSQRSEQLGVLNSSENIIVRYDIRTQVETSMLCSAICRSALELIHAEVMKKVHGQEEPGTMDNCNCATRIRYLLPCSHQIQLGVPIQVAQVHPRWRIQGPLPAVTGPRVNLDLSAIAGLKDPAVLVRRKGRPRGTRRLSTSAEIVQRAADRAERVRRCGSCRMVGHTRRTCPVPDNDAANGTGEEDERQDKNEKDGSTIEEIWTNILSTIKDANVDGSDNGG